MKLTKGNLLYEGKAKKIYATSELNKVLIEFKNDATAFNALKHSSFDGKGRLNCQISSFLFEYLEGKNIPTHFLGIQDDSWILASKVDVIPLEVVIRNIATGSLCRETPLDNGIKLNSPLLDFYYKDDKLGDPLLTERRLKLLDIVSNEQQILIEDLAFKINDFLIDFFDSIDLVLVDFKLEFGITYQSQIILADEISPDTCRLWDQRNDDPKGRILDKDRFRQDLGGVIEAYGEILKRIQGVLSKPRICS